MASPKEELNFKSDGHTQPAATAHDRAAECSWRRSLESRRFFALAFQVHAALQALEAGVGRDRNQHALLSPRLLVPLSLTSPHPRRAGSARRPVLPGTLTRAPVRDALPRSDLPALPAPGLPPLHPPQTSGLPPLVSLWCIHPLR